MVLVANLAIEKDPKPRIMTETQAYGYSYESYPMNTNMTWSGCFNVLVFWAKVASALEGLSMNYPDI